MEHLSTQLYQAAASLLLNSLQTHINASIDYYKAFFEQFFPQKLIIHLYAQLVYWNLHNIIHQGGLQSPEDTSKVYWDFKWQVEIRVFVVHSYRLFTRFVCNFGIWRMLHMCQIWRETQDWRMGWCLKYLCSNKTLTQPSIFLAFGLWPLKPILRWCH